MRSKTDATSDTFERGQAAIEGDTSSNGEDSDESDSETDFDKLASAPYKRRLTDSL